MEKIKEIAEQFVESVADDVEELVFVSDLAFKEAIKDELGIDDNEKVEELTDEVESEFIKLAEKRGWEVYIPGQFFPYKGRYQDAWSEGLTILKPSE